jgi:hypothetical protein
LPRDRLEPIPRKCYVDLAGADHRHGVEDEASRLSLSLCVSAIAWAIPASAQQPDQRVADLVTAGKIRMGVFPSFQYSKGPNGEARGLAIGITRALASRLRIGEVITVEYPTPPQVVECVKSGGCDLGFMSIDPARATEVDFTPAFVRADFTYLLPAGCFLPIEPQRELHVVAQFLGDGRWPEHGAVENR